MKSKKKAYIGIGLCMVGMVCIVCLYIAEYNKPHPDTVTLTENLAASIICSLMASFIFFCMEKGITNDRCKKIEDYLEKNDTFYNSGCVSIRKKEYHDEDDVFWKKIIMDTNNQLDLIGHSLHHWFYPTYKGIFCKKIRKMMKAKKRVRIILSGDKPCSEKIKNAYHKNIEINELNDVEQSCLYLLQIRESVEHDKQEYLSVYVVDLSYINYLYIKTDLQCFVAPYTMTKKKSHNSFLLELKTNSEYTKSFDEDLNDIIGKSTPINWKEMV